MQDEEKGSDSNQNYGPNIALKGADRMNQSDLKKSGPDLEPRETVQMCENKISAR
jgi:hypothetical protein